MGDVILNYRACGAECREDWLRTLACDNGLPLAEVQRAADRFGEAEDFHISSLLALGFLLFVITFVVLAAAKIMINRAEKAKGF